MARVTGLIMAASIVLAGCAVPPKAVMDEIRRDETIGDEIIAKVPEIAYCFNLSKQEAKADLRELVIKAYDEELTPLDSVHVLNIGDASHKAGEKAVIAYIERHRANFLQGRLSNMEREKCELGFTSLAKK